MTRIGRSLTILVLYFNTCALFICTCRWRILHLQVHVWSHYLKSVVTSIVTAVPFMCRECLLSRFVTHYSLPISAACHTDHVCWATVKQQTHRMHTLHEPLYQGQQKSHLHMSGSWNNKIAATTGEFFRCTIGLTWQSIPLSGRTHPLWRHWSAEQTQEHSRLPYKKSHNNLAFSTVYQIYIVMVKLIFKIHKAKTQVAKKFDMIYQNIKVHKAETGIL